MKLWAIGFVLVCAGGLMTACATPPKAGATATNFRQYTIRLTPNQGQGKLNVPGNQGCTGAGNKNGCVNFFKGELGVITFQIQGGKSNLICDGSPPEPQWVIRQIRLSGDGLPATGKGDFTLPIDSWVQASFPQLNPATGIAYQADATATSGAVLINLNQSTTENYIYYEVTATNCDKSITLVTDPRVQNGGK